MDGDSGYSQARRISLRARHPVENANIAHAAGCSRLALLDVALCGVRAYGPSVPGIVSTRAVAVGRYVRRCEDHLPHPCRAELGGHPGTVSPAVEWPTMRRSSSPAFSMSDTTRFHPVVIFKRPQIAGLDLGDRGRSTASTVNSGAMPVDFVNREFPAVGGDARRRARAPTRAVPWRLPVSRAIAEPHRKARAATVRPDSRRRPVRTRPSPARRRRPARSLRPPAFPGRPAAPRPPARR